MTLTAAPDSAADAADRPPVDEATPSRPIAALVPLVGGHLGTFAWTVLSGLVYHVTVVGAAVIGAWLVGSAVTGAPAEELRALLPWLLGFVIVAALARWWQMWVAHDLAYQLLADLRVRLFDGLERRAPRYLLGRRTGDLATTVMSDVETIEWFYAHTIADYLVTVVVSGGAVVAIAFVDPWLALALLLFLLLLATVPVWLARRADAQGSQLRGELGALGAEVIDGVQGLRELVAFGRGEDYLERLRRRTRELQSRQMAYARRSSVEAVASDALTAAGITVVLVISAVLVTGGSLDRAMLPVAVVLAASAFGPVIEVSGTARSLGQIRASARRVFTVARQRAHVVDRTTEAPPAPEPRVVFDDVRFRYEAERGYALDGASFTVERGETVALVGHSGAGKSTCANLLLRFWDVDEGAITIGGHDLRDVPQRAVRDLVSVVPQHVYLFNRSILDNLRLGNPDAPDEAVFEAARQARAHDFITALPDGYDTMAGEQAIQLSGGQRQRIAIARALLRDSPILVLDEAVSNLDGANEEALQSAIRMAREGRTTLLIAHRLSTIRTADRIVVLRDGRAVETGTHAQLINAGGEYARLLAGQTSDLIDHRGDHEG
ncbi:thiol reductant ABC exporter subunit CydC [Saccharothrix xinjiangensis]|uniref:Thiol reductant ABC exporter subunit CydC n=1 Tax=Saccharothrix xinjiangensis TaxID=204798 RepID=A0ABV9XV06_9PSEU